MTHYAISVSVENRRGEDTAQGDAETMLRGKLSAVGIPRHSFTVMWSETVSRPTFTNGDTTWGIQVTATVSDGFDDALDDLQVEAIEQVAVEEP